MFAFTLGYLAGLATYHLARGPAAGPATTAYVARGREALARLLMERIVPALVPPPANQIQDGGVKTRSKRIRDAAIADAPPF